MKVLSVVSQKGGVGKTTVALNTAFALARRGHRVLLAEVDPQGGIGLSLQNMKPGPGLAGYVANSLPLEQVLVKTRIKEFDLLPIGNIAIEDTHAFAARLAEGLALQRLVSDSSAGYDLLVLDTPSGFGGATMAALRVSTAVLSPLQSEPLAMRSASQLLEVLSAVRKEGSAVTLAGFLLTMLEIRNNESLNVAVEAWMEFPTESVLRTTIPRDPIFLKASAAGVPVGLLSHQQPPVAALFDQVAVEIEGQIGLRKEVRDDGPISLLA
jgi:chromosome partitioning protein